MGQLPNDPVLCSSVRKPGLKEKRKDPVHRLRVKLLKERLTDLLNQWGSLQE